MKAKLNEQKQIKAMAHLFELLWKCDVNTNEIYVYLDKITPELSDTSHEYEYIYNLYLNNHIHPIDKNLWKHFLSKENLNNFFASNKESINFYIRLINNEVSFEWHEVFITKADDNCIMISSHNADSNYQYESIGKAIGTELDYVININAENNSYVLYTPKSQDLNNAPPLPVFGDNYYSTLFDYYNIFGIMEESNEFFEQLKLENITAQLDKNEEYILYSTIFHNNKYFYKKLRFCYLDKDKKSILMSCLDVSNTFKEYNILKEEKNKYQNQLIHYLDNMPIAYCTTKVLVDESGKPYDFVYTYSNKAHSDLEKVKYGELVGKAFYKFFKSTDKMWLNYYYDTAFNGVLHILDDYSPEIDKSLLIHTYQPADQFCGCVVQDVSAEKSLELKVKQSQERVNKLLNFTTDIIFQYDLETKTIFASAEDIAKRNLLPEISNAPCSLFENNLLTEESLKEFEKAVDMLKAGEKEVSFNIKTRFNENEDFRWFKLTFFSYNEMYTNKLCVLGYLKDINLIMQQQEILKAEAELDPLTKIFNVRTGKKLVEKHLLAENNYENYNAMLLMDLDDFKNINDTLGHQEGDKVLKRLVKILLSLFRNTDIIYRLGGDEFAVFIKDIKDPEFIIERIMKDFFSSLKEKSDSAPFNSSVGIFITNKKYSYDYYYLQADKALYQAKKQGKNNFSIIFD